MKKALVNKIGLLLLFVTILFFIHGCKRVNPNSNEVNALLYFVTRTEHGGDTQIDQFKRFDCDKETIYYYLKWNYISGENTDEREHLIVFDTSILKSELYPLSRIDDYPSLEIIWDELKVKNDFTDFSKDQIEEFIETVKIIRIDLESRQS
jgi:hypothetical protein